MIKSIKTGIILLAALLLAWLLPWCYAFVFASPSWSPFTLYSCVTHGFASVDFDRENNVAGRDLQGNTYTQQQFDSILPTFYYRQLAAEGRFPSEIEGVAVESRDVERTNFMFRTSPGEINRRRPTVYQLLESMPDRIDLEPATDVFRITGVLSVIGGWFITAGAAFIAAAVVCAAMYYGGLAVQIGFIALVVYILFFSGKSKKRGECDADGKDLFRLMMRAQEPEIVWDLLKKYVRHTQSAITARLLDDYEMLIDGFESNRPSPLRKVMRHLRRAKQELRNVRKQQLVALQRVPIEMAMERNTWFHVGVNASQQLIYCMQRMLEPIKEHVDNNFTPVPMYVCTEYQMIKIRIVELMRDTETQISTGRFDRYRDTLAAADQLKDELSQYRHRQIDRLQGIEDNGQLQVGMLYLNLLQESQQLLSNLRHQLRAAKKFME